ncbi:lytic transglycosylase domain-containing protein [bacterium]|nr:lytic transglycosylase domain-containing protein [bacterium]
MLQRVLASIGQVESGGRDLGVHPDGASWGRYGVTHAALEELIRVGRWHTPAEQTDLSDPAINETVATEYLLLMYERNGHSWREAVGWYHGAASWAARDAYARKVWQNL